MTRHRPFAIGTGMIFSSPTEVQYAYDLGKVHLQAAVKVRIHGVMEETTVGRALLSEIVPVEIALVIIIKLLEKKDLADLIDYCFRKAGTKKTVLLADNVMESILHAIRAGFLSQCMI